MRKKKDPSDKRVAPYLSREECDKKLKKVGKLLKEKRESRGTVDDFAYETKVSRSAINNYEAGKNMNLRTFFRLLYGLEIDPIDFFKELKARPNE
jgi:transcriptional regulator with XRE-family HTH domain